MTQTLDTPTQTPTDRAERWLHDFEEALRARDVARAAGMFAATSSGDDRVQWNITNVENPRRNELLTSLTGRTHAFAWRSGPKRATGDHPWCVSRPQSAGRGCWLARRRASPGRRLDALYGEGFGSRAGGRPMAPSTAPTSSG